MCAQGRDAKGVIESAVIGLLHHDYGEAVTAVVCKRQSSELTEEEIIESLRSQIAPLQCAEEGLLRR